MPEGHHHDTASCLELLAQLGDYVDGSLAAELCRELNGHLQDCPDCRVVVDTLAQTVQLYRTLAAEPVALPVDVEARLLMRLSRGS